MRSIASIFGRGDERPEAVNPLPVAKFACVHHDGRFCVLRLEAADPGALDADSVTLVVASAGGTQGFLAIEHSDVTFDETRVAEFLIPASLLDEDDFALELGDTLFLLPIPDERLAETPPDATTTEAAYSAIQDQLAAQGHRLESLRRDTRDIRNRAIRAEDELESATSRFNESLVSHRTDLHAEHERSASLERRTREAEAAAERERARREEVERGRQSELDERQAEIDQLRTELEQARAQIAELTSARSSAGERLTATETEAERARATAADLRERIAAVEQELERERERGARLERELAEERERAQTLDGHEGAVRAELDEARAALADHRNSRDQLESDLQAAGERIAALERERSELSERHEAEAARLRSELHEKQERLAAAGSARADEEERLIALADEAEREREARAQLQARLEEAQVQDDDARSRLDENEARDEQQRSRIEELERELSTSAERHQTADSALAEIRSTLVEERADRAELAARLEAAEGALAGTRQARYRVEQRVRELESALEAARAETGSLSPMPIPMPEPELEFADLASVEVIDADGDPAIAPEALVTFEVDALAELYAVALDATRSRERGGGNQAQGDRWRRFSRAVVDEAARRPALFEEEISGSRRGSRAVERRRDRLRAQLRAAVTPGGSG